MSRCQGDVWNRILDGTHQSGEDVLGEGGKNGSTPQGEPMDLLQAWKEREERGFLVDISLCYDDDDVSFSPSKIDHGGMLGMLQG